MKAMASNSLRVLVAMMIAIAITAPSAMAKGKKDKGNYVQPAITAEQAIMSVQNALPRHTTGKSYIKTSKQGNKQL